MGKLGYLMRRVRYMNPGQYLQSAKKVHARSGKATLFVLADMAICGMKYQAGYMDYLVFEFDKLNAAQRKTYVTRGVNNHLVKLLNDPAATPIFADKVQTLKTFAEFVGRPWLFLPEATPEAFAAFVDATEKFVAKPIDGTCGRGVEFFASKEVADAKALYAQLMESGQTLVEAFVTQHPAMAAIYPDSVNTLRLVTVRWQEETHFVFLSLRIGNGLLVDNLNAGGMATVLDENGVILKPCADKDGKVYNAHPKTGLHFEGYQIPMFGEALALVKACSVKVPRVGYVGWDVAITEKGPVLIEANNFPGHDIYQFQAHLPQSRMGIKPRFDKIFGKTL